MIGAIADAWYFPNLKAKLGECTALGSARAVVRARMTPICIVPPAGYDAELKRRLGPLEHIKLFGQRLGAWGRNIIFIDAALVDDATHREALESHPLTALLERGHLMGALACPLITLDASAEYQSAVRRFAEYHKPLPICLRLRAADLESRALGKSVEDLLLNLRVDERRIVVVIDFGFIALPPVPAAIADFTNLLIDRVNALPGLHDWLAIAIATTSFPQEIKKLKAGDIGRYARSDWAIYRKLFERREEVIRLPAFSDYAVESLAFQNVGGVWPTAQFRYTAREEYLLVKGQSTRTGGYEAIFEVAKRLVGLPEYSGAEFSDGDAYVGSLAASSDSTGNASMWRWASTDHHLAFVMSGLGSLRGETIETRLPAEPEQLLLWAQ